MNTDLVTLAGYLFATWLTGYTLGLIIYAFKRLTEQI
jgi:hypothetical protein